MAATTQDLRYALRVLRNAPGFTIIAALTLGLGIGANTAMVGLFDALLVRPPEGVRDPERVVRLEAEMPALPGRPPEMTDALSYPQLTALRARARGFQGVAAYATTPLGVGEAESGRNEQVVLASGEYFRVLGVRAALGRLIQPEDDREGAANPVAVLSWDYWQRAFGGDPGVLGRAIRVNEQQFTVIGVGPRHFVGAELQAPALWVPLSLSGSLGYDQAAMRSPYVSWLKIVGRLAPGVTEEQARATAQAAFLAAAEEGAHVPPLSFGRGGTPGGARISMRIDVGRGPDQNNGPAPAPPRVHLSRLGGVGQGLGGVPGGSGGQPPVQMWYLAVTAAVLLIACANVANLLLARGAHREHELAVRLSMGATPRRLARQLFTESAVLAILGAVVGYGIALGVWRMLPGLASLPPLPPLLDVRALAITAVLTVATVVLFGLIPLLGLRRPDIRRVLGSAAPSVARGSRGRSVLVVVQFAVCVVLLISAGLFVRSFQNVQTLDLGFDRDRLVSVTADTRGAGWTPERSQEFWDAARERVGRIPGVRSAEVSAVMPYRMRIMMPMRAQSSEPVSPEDVSPVQFDFVGPRYFETMGIEVIEGRPFTDQDRAGSAPVAMVSRSFARRSFGAAPAVGQCLTSPMSGQCIEIVGVAEDARLGDLTDETPEFIYRPLEQRSPMMTSARALHVRTEGNLSQLVPLLRRELQAVGGAAPSIEVLPIAELLAPQLAPWRSSAVLLGVFGAIGLLLAAVGLYGVMAFLVNRRTREIGIRLALGAAGQSIVRLILRDAARMVGAGAVLGLVLAAFATRVIGSMLYDVSTLDPLVYLGTAGLLIVVALLAALAPTRRALRVEPMEALRTD